MKLTLEKDLKVAVEVNGAKFIGSEEGVLYQSITDTEILLYIKSEPEGKEIKIKIAKDVNNQGA
ncbi:MAG: hypothetical protein GYA51_04110 [Candidatus Methanofastidiosa archaeon]|jgi:hypothetical protein|nr:hypothetical protein [Candidatus Methanofastidiosa archaeon]